MRDSVEGNAGDRQLSRRIGVGEGTADGAADADGRMADVSERLGEQGCPCRHRG